MVSSQHSQQSSINKSIELIQQNISYLQKELTSKNEIIKSLLEAQSALIESINKSTANHFRMPVPTMEPQQNHFIYTYLLIYLHL